MIVDCCVKTMTVSPTGESGRAWALRICLGALLTSILSFVPHLFMQLFKYRYRPVHAISEWFFEILAPLLPSVESKTVAESPRKILVLKFGGMGEAILARSVVEHLRHRNPFMNFDFLVENRTLEAMTCGSRSNSFVYHPGKDGLSQALRMLREIRSRRYDAILDFEQRSLLTAAFTWATSIPVRIGFVPPEPGPRDRLFTHSIKLQERESMWTGFVKLGRVVDPHLPESLTTSPLPYSSETERWIEGWWSTKVSSNHARSPVVAMHLGVGPSAQYRRWPMERFAELATRLFSLRKDLTVVLTGGSSEQPLMADFKSRWDGRTVDASDLGGIERTAALLQRCDLLISCDTGIMHLGAAMGTPTVGLFGPNTPHCWAPVGPRATYVYTTRQPCSPCMNSYIRHIPDKCIASRESACMWDIDASDVLETARTVIRDSWLG